MNFKKDDLNIKTEVEYDIGQKAMQCKYQLYSDGVLDKNTKRWLV